MEQASSARIVNKCMPRKSSRARARRTCRSSSRRLSSWSSISKPREHSCLTCRRSCSPAPTRSSNNEAAAVHHASRQRGCVAACGARSPKARSRRGCSALPRGPMAGATGPEPATFGVTGRRINLSNQGFSRLFKCGNAISPVHRPAGHHRSPGAGRTPLPRFGPLSAML